MEIQATNISKRYNQSWVLNRYPLQYFQVRWSQLLEKVVVEKQHY